MSLTSRRSSADCSNSTTARVSEKQPAKPPSSAGAGAASPKDCCNPSINVVAVGDTQRLSPEEQIRFAREQFEAADDFAVAVEEEFAVLEPATLSLTNRFEELQAAAKGTPLEPHLVGELIASEVEIRTGRCQG